MEQIKESLYRIQRRFSDIQSPDEFTANDDNLDKLEAIAMILIIAGESFRKIGIETDGEWLTRYPEIDWHGVIGLRNVLANDYFDIDAKEILSPNSPNSRLSDYLSPYFFNIHHRAC